VTSIEPTVIHFVEPLMVSLSSRSVLGRSRVMQYGDELAITDEVLEASRDRLGNSWLEDWLSSGEEEYRRGDKPIARRGPWPADVCRLAPGSFERADARQAAIEDAFAITDPQARAVRRREIDEFFGPGEPTSRTHMNVVPGAAR
jgi:hypothetical protein